MKRPPKNSIETLPAKINGATLESITGIGERRLRQLGEQNQIPLPKDGLWPFAETIRAVVSHYRTAGEGDKLDAAKLAKLEAETRLLELTEGERNGKLIDLENIVTVMTRGLGSMVSCVMGMVDIPIERREEIILRLREAGESVVADKPPVDTSAKSKARHKAGDGKTGKPSTNLSNGDVAGDSIEAGKF